MGTLVKELPAGLRVDTTPENGFYVGRRAVTTRNFCATETPDTEKAIAVGACSETKNPPKIYIDEAAPAFYVPVTDGFYRVDSADGLKNRYDLEERMHFVQGNDFDNFSEWDYFLNVSDTFDNFHESLRSSLPNQIRWDGLCTVMERFKAEPDWREKHPEAVRAALQYAWGLSGSLYNDVSDTRYADFLTEGFYYLASRADFSLDFLHDMQKTFESSYSSLQSAVAGELLVAGAHQLLARATSVDEEFDAQYLLGDKEKVFQLMHDPALSVDNAFKALDYLVTTGGGLPSRSYYQEQLAAWASDNSKPLSWRIRAAQEMIAGGLSHLYVSQEEREEAFRYLSDLLADPSSNLSDQLDIAYFFIDREDKPELKDLGFAILQKVSEDSSAPFTSRYKSALRICREDEPGWSQRAAMLLLALSQEPVVNSLDGRQKLDAANAASCAESLTIYLAIEPTHALLALSRNPLVSLGDRFLAVQDTFLKYTVEGFDLSGLRSSLKDLEEQDWAGSEDEQIEEMLERVDEFAEMLAEEKEQALAGASQQHSSNYYVQWSQ
ncbi:MAG: hypothetical protein Q7S68_04825 [Deltaproteobacteria bacterium]|nr:hypothetical protein [Deltaproteobacteria bacterium]